MVENGTAGIVPGYESDMPAYRVKLSGHLGGVVVHPKHLAAGYSDIRERQRRLSQRSTVKP